MSYIVSLVELSSGRELFSNGSASMGDQGQPMYFLLLLLLYYQECQWMLLQPPSPNFKHMKYHLQLSIITF